MPKFFNHRLTTRSRAIFSVLRGLHVVGLSRPVLRQLLKLAPKVFEKMERSAFENYRPQAHDVFVAAFPKSGNNWMMQISQQIAYKGEAEFFHIHDLVAWPHAPLPELVVPLDEPVHLLAPTGLRVIKSQLKHPGTPYDEDARYLYIVRDPKDVTVSMFHFANGLINNVIDVGFSLEDLIEFGRSSHSPLCWAEHTASWWALRHKDNVLMLTFQEMKDDLSGVVHRVATHMGVELSDEQHQRVVARSAFKYMKSHEHQFAPPWPTFRGESAVMIRTGKSGGAKTALTEEQRNDIDQHYIRKLQSLGCDFPYEEMFG